MSLPSPSKSLIDGNRFAASLNFICHRSTFPIEKGKMLHQLKILIGKDRTNLSFSNVDLYEPINNDDKLHFYIFNPEKYQPSSDPATLECTKKQLFKDLKDSGKESGFEYRSHRTLKWGEQGKQYSKFYLQCNQKTKSTSTTTDDDIQDYHKFATSNGTRKLFSEPKGNKGNKRIRNATLPTRDMGCE